MASVHFNNMKPKKKQFIIDNIAICLKKHGCDKITVKDIINECEISRMSFYNYFDDIHDAILTVTEYKFIQYIDIIKQSILECNGNVFDGFIKAYNPIKTTLVDSLTKSIFTNTNYFVKIFSELIYKKETNNFILECVEWAKVNTNEAKAVNDTKKIINQMQMAFTITFDSIIRDLYENTSFSHQNDFEYKMRLIQKGIMYENTN